MFNVTVTDTNNNTKTKQFADFKAANDAARQVKQHDARLKVLVQRTTPPANPFAGDSTYALRKHAKELRAALKQDDLSQAEGEHLDMELALVNRELKSRK